MFHFRPGVASAPRAGADHPESLDREGHRDKRALLRCKGDPEIALLVMKGYVYVGVYVRSDKKPDAD